MVKWTQVVLEIPPQTRSTWFPLKKPLSQGKKNRQGTSASPLETKQGCCTPVWNTWNFCMPLSRHIGSIGHAGLRNSHQARETPQPWEAGTHRGHILHPLPHPKGSGKLLCPAEPHREEKPRVDLIPAYTVATYVRQRAAWCPQDREEDVVQKPNPLNHHASSSCSLHFFNHEHFCSFS